MGLIENSELSFKHAKDSSKVESVASWNKNGANK